MGSKTHALVLKAGEDIYVLNQFVHLGAISQMLFAQKYVTGLGHVWAPTHFGPNTFRCQPQLIWAPTHLGPDSFGPQHIWAPTHLGPDSFGPGLISELKWGPNEPGAQLRNGPKCVPAYYSNPRITRIYLKCAQADHQTKWQ
jgi:hypothetical protein